ncbi:MAG: hypothetical protein GF398_22030 [Chitinivibrionales bacterium]|nr:hypothetical protein [Chitinivibrionales bacterium]
MPFIRIKAIAICAALLSSALSVAAQSVLGLQFPTGIPNDISAGQARAMGGGGVGVQNHLNLINQNPANTGGLDKIAFGTLVNFDFLTIHDQNAYTNHVSVEPVYVGFGFPIGPAGAFSFSFDKRYDAQVKFSTTGSFESALSASETITSFDSLQNAYSRNGGITVFQVGWAFDIKKLAFIGLTYERAYLSIDGTQLSYAFGQTLNSDGRLSAFSVSARDSAAVQGGFHGFRGGIQVPYKNFTFGLAGEYFFEDSVELFEASHSSLGGIGVDSRETGVFQLAPSVTVGASYRFDEKWLIALDYGVTLWKYFDAPAYFIYSSAENAHSVSFGGEFFPAPNLLVSRYWEKLRYRAGFGFSQLPEDKSREWKIAVGTGLPVGGNGMFDITLTYGNRTSSTYEDYREEMFGISFSLVGSRKWGATAKGSY